MSTIKRAGPQELAFDGFTHRIRVLYTDFNDTAATTKTVQVFPSGSGTVPIGTEVQCLGGRIITNFDGGATSALDLILGDGGDDNRFLTAWEVHEDATEVKHLVTPVTTSPYQYLAADGIDVTATATGANLNTLTQGEVEIYLRVIDAAARKVANS